MPLPIHALAQLVSSMKSEVRLVQSFARDVETSLDRMKPPRPDGFSADDAEEVQRFKALIDEVLAAKPKRGQEVSVTFTSKSERIAAFLLRAAGMIKYRTFLAEMSLSYLVSYLEAFEKDYVLVVLQAEPKMLKSGSTITFEELAGHRSIKSVWRAAAEKEAEVLGYGGIDDVAAYFKRRFGVDLRTFKRWDALRETVYRRNLIVHNRGRVNELYRRRTGYKGKSSSLTVDLAYVFITADILIEFFDFLHAQVCAKYAK